jgi:hypothetical protein
VTNAPIPLVWDRPVDRDVAFFLTAEADGRLVAAFVLVVAADERLPDVFFFARDDDALFAAVLFAAAFLVRAEAERFVAGFSLAGALVLLAFFPAGLGFDRRAADFLDVDRFGLLREAGINGGFHVGLRATSPTTRLVYLSD